MLSLILSACKSVSVPQKEEPSPSLFFKNIEAVDPNYLSLFFTLEIEDHAHSTEMANIESWQVELNGRRVSSGFSLDYPAADVFKESSPLRLNMDMAALAAQGLAPADDYKVKLTLELGFPNLAARVEVSGLAAVSGVQAPVFSITAIAILKAELINTRFRVTMNIDNPNPFPVDLSAFSYVLYGNGLLWADGTETDVMRIPAKSSLEGNLFLLMNFIDMNRDLLDQIINLVDVNYRFAGDAQVITGVDYLPRFKTGFDLSGYSQVLER